MSETFFSRLAVETPTRVWVNNPTASEVGLALEQGAVGCTTNPAFVGGLLRRAPGQVRAVVAACVREADDDAAAADLVQHRLVAQIVEQFQPLFERSEGRQGFVSIQGAPDADRDPAAILQEALAGRTIGPNATPKLPATGPGLIALDALIATGSPSIVTEVFSLAQLVETCERYIRATDRLGSRPPFFISPITGIFGDHLKEVAAREGLPIDKADIELAGVALSRACLRVVEERGYPVTLLCGGARTPFDLLGLAGARLHATINWSTFAEVLERGPDVRPGFDQAIDPAAVVRLEATFDDVRRALQIDGLDLEEFEEFGPVQHFRRNFMTGWQTLRDAITQERAAVAQ